MHCCPSGREPFLKNALHETLVPDNSKARMSPGIVLSMLLRCTSGHLAEIRSWQVLRLSHSFQITASRAFLLGIIFQNAFGWKPGVTVNEKCCSFDIHSRLLRGMKFSGIFLKKSYGCADGYLAESRLRKLLQMKNAFQITARCKFLLQ